MKKNSFWIIFPLLLVSGLSWAEVDNDAGDGRNIQVILNSEAREESLQVKAWHVHLNQVFEAIADATGVKVHYSGIPDDFVSVNCAGISLKHVMECLLGSEADMIFRYPDKASPPADTDKPVELWILNSNFDSNAAQIQNKSTAECSPSENSVSAKQLSSEKQPKDDEQSRRLETERLLTMTAAEDPTQRSQALSQLIAQGNADSTEVRKALQLALSDQDPEVRAQAVSGWARLNGANASAVLQAALHDSDASVRLMAVDSAKDDVGLLQEALADSDAAVREYAALRLKDIANPDNDE